MPVARLILLLAAVQAAACSFMFVNGPPAAHEHMPYFDCTTNLAAPIIDTVFAAADIAALPVNGYNASQGTLDNSEGVITGNVFGVVLFAASAVYGFYETAQCRKAVSELSVRSLAAPPPPPDYIPPPPSPGVPPAPGSGTAGCQRDTDCKGDRICNMGMCTEAHP